MPKLTLPDEVKRRLRSPQAPLRPARTPAEAAVRALRVEQVRAARQQIAQLLLDVEYWNTHIRRPDELPVDPDPDGDLALLAKFYDAILRHDTQ